MKRTLLPILTLAFLAAGFAGCLKKDFDAPPDTRYEDPNIPVTNTIAEILAMNGSYNNSTKDDTLRFTTDMVIAGTVVANDRSGNFYKAIVLQDGTAGIQLLIDDFSLYADYPVGRKVYIRLNGLWLGYDGGTPVLGGGVTPQRGIESISGANIEAHIIKGPVDQPLVADTVDLADIAVYDDRYVNRLVVIREAQFQEQGLSYSEPVATTNRYIEDCDENDLVVRTSNYADFAGQPLPAGRGTIAGIYTVFISTGNSGFKTPQLLLRDTTDVRMTQPRCGAPAGGTTILSQQFESVSTVGNLAIPGWRNISHYGNIYYTGGVFSNNKYARVSGFNGDQSTIESWLITPPLNLAAYSNPRLQFLTLEGFDNGATLEALVSTDYNGSSQPWNSTWTVLPAEIAAGTSSGYAPNFTQSGTINLNAYSGSNVYIAWRYKGSDPSKTTTFEVDDVFVTAD